MATRRFVLIGGAAALVVVATKFGCAGMVHEAEALAPQGTLSPAAWVRVTPGDRVEIYVGKSEIGQGITTGFATIVAEELGARLDQIDIVLPVADENYDDPVLHTMLTGGSFSIPNQYAALRNAGAAARAMLEAAAANAWQADVTQCQARDGLVRGPGGKSATFGSLASAASTLSVPSAPALRDPATYAFVGKHVPRFDIPAKVDGSAKFGIDTVLPGMKFATVVHPPVFGATFAAVDDKAARAIRGVRDVFPISSGVAVLADTTWHAFAGARALTVRWNEPAGKPDSAALFAQAEQLAADGGKRKVAKHIGDASVTGTKTIRATYRGPFLAHAAMEPMNATASVGNGKCLVYAPTQVQSAARALAASAAGVSIDDVELHTTLIGGGFGRRLHADYVREAVEIAKHAGVPVKMTWTREEDVTHDYYRPMFHSDVRAEVDAHGSLIALEQTIVGPSTLRLSLPEYSAGKIDGEFVAAGVASSGFVTNLFIHGFDSETVQGIADSPYFIPNIDIGVAELTTPVPVGDFRAPQSNWNTFVLETIVDECAHAGGRTPADLRRELLKNSPRGLAVLERVLAMSRTATPKPGDRHALGIGFVWWNGSFAGTVAQVSLRHGAPKVERLWLAADAGRIINPDNVIAQLEGGALFALSAAMTGKITLRGGAVEQRNFNDYQVLRMADAPPVEAALIPSSESPTGVGEIGVPGVAPAIANAMFALTGKRVRDLPFT